ncbi:MAG: transposase [Cyanobacteria bacterium QS_8_48_54]|nr:MAG: transposase [Cyanobacteria bacterium QS_8_48_54]
MKFEGRARFPRFKSKHGKQSLQYPQSVKLSDHSLYFPKIGWVSAKIHRTFEGKLKTVTVSKNKRGHYYASLLFDDGKPEPQISTQGKAVGIDLGIKEFAITSDGSKFSNPKHLPKHESNLKRKQKKLSRKKKGSTRRQKARQKLARAYEKVSNARQDFHHQLSRKLVNENQVIIAENLNVKAMLRNHKLAKSIADCGWGTFLNFVSYKAKEDGKTFLEIDRFFPSSKTCNHCLNVVDSLPLDVRNWTCQSCQTQHDRDINASINIRDEGLRVLASGTEATASGGNVRPARGRKSSVLANAVETGS